MMTLILSTTSLGIVVPILVIRRKDEMVIPMGTTRLASEDRLSMVGDLDVLEAIDNWVS